MTRALTTQDGVTCARCLGTGVDLIGDVCPCGGGKPLHGADRPGGIGKGGGS